MEMYTTNLKDNRTGKIIKGRMFAGRDKADVVEVIKIHCFEENLTPVTELKIVNDSFDLNPTDIDLELKTDDLEQDIFDAIDAIGEHRMVAPSANDNIFKT